MMRCAGRGKCARAGGRRREGAPEEAPVRGEGVAEASAAKAEEDSSSGGGGGGEEEEVRRWKDRLVVEGGHGAELPEAERGCRE